MSYAQPTAPRPTGTSTRWIWLSIAAQALSFLMILFIPWDSFIELLRSGVASPTGEPDPIAFRDSMVASLLISLAALPLGAAPIVFGYLDWRELTRRGVERPFHWAFTFLTFVTSTAAIVYPIGRSVVLGRRGRPDWAPMWAAIAVHVLGLILAIVVLARMIGMFLEVAQVAGSVI